MEPKTNSPKFCQETCTNQQGTRLDDPTLDNPPSPTVAVNTALPGCVSEVKEVKENSTWCRQYGRCGGHQQAALGYGRGDTPNATLSFGPTHTTVFRVRFEARFVRPTRRPPSKSDHDLMLFCAPADLVGPAFPAPQAPVLGSGLDPPVLPACSAPHDEPNGQLLWLVSGTGCNRQGSKIRHTNCRHGFLQPRFDIM